MRTLLSVGFDALTYSMVLFVISIGLSVTLGLMKIVNLAHGAFAMVGGYVASYATQTLGLPYGVAVLAAVLGAILVGIPLERNLYRRIYGKSELIQVLMTIGITFIIIGVANYVFGPTMKVIALPAFLQQPVDIGFRTIAAHRLFAIFIGVAVATALWLVFEKSLFGIHLRASVDDTAMAGALGVRTGVVFSVTFGLASGLAALGGVVGAQLLPIEPYYALRYLVTLVVIVAVGGSGSIVGTLLASLLLGTIETMGRYFAPEYGELFFYLAVILIILVLPRGFYGRAA